MYQQFIHHCFFCLFCALYANSALSEPRHGIAMHGEPALAADFNHFPYVNPHAPKGGSISYGVLGTFDSLNPFIIKSQGNTARGIWDTQFGYLIYEPLMFRSRDEPFTMYGLLAQSVETADDRSWVEFTLDPQARWSDGKPVSVEDVIFTYELLEAKGRPPYSSRMDKIERIEITGERKVRFILNQYSDREFPLIIALSPILPKHAINRETFDQSTLVPPIGSGPYLISAVEPGKHITFTRNNNYWATNLPSKRGFDNYDTIKVEYFRNFSSQFEAFKKGLFDVLETRDPSQWQRDYDFPAVTDGRVAKDSFTTGKPANLYGFVFNTRKPVFKIREVRRALSMLFDFEWINKNLFFNAYQRTGSFWHGSYLSSLGIPASEQERQLLRDYLDMVAPEVLDGTYLPPVSNGSGRDRKIMRLALNELKKQGFVSRAGKLMDDKANLLAFEILTKNRREEKLAIAYQNSLERIGVTVSIRTVDDAQYQRRIQTYDYDMMLRSHSASLSPGIEQVGRWGSSTLNMLGSYNYAGVGEPAIDHVIKAMVQAVTREQFTTAVRALDRLLISGHYVVPLFHLNEQWVARWKHIAKPEQTSLYGYQYPTWWDKRAE